MGGNSYSKGHGFKSLHRILDEYFFTFICCKNCNVCLKKRPGRPIFLKKMPWTFHLRNIFIQSVKRPDLAWPLLPNLAKANILSSLNEGCHMDEAGECSFPDWNLPQLFWHLRKSHKEAIETGFRPGRCWPNGHRARLRLHESEFKSHGSLLFLFSKIVCKDHA